MVRGGGSRLVPLDRRNRSYGRNMFLGLVGLSLASVTIGLKDLVELRPKVSKGLGRKFIISSSGYQNRRGFPSLVSENTLRVRGGQSGKSGADEPVITDIVPPMMNMSFAEAQHQVALDLLREDRLDEALDILSDVLEWRTKTFGEKAIECASTWHHYGVALFKKARSSQGVIGEAAKYGIRQLSEHIVSQSLNSTSGTNGTEAEGGEEMQAEADEDEDEDNDEEDMKLFAEGGGDDGEAAKEEFDLDVMGRNITGPDDMELAWQALEVARLIYSKDTSHKLELAEVHGSLAELSLEREHFETAIGDYRSAITCLEAAMAMGHAMFESERRLADLQFRLCLAYQLDGTQKLVENSTEVGQSCIREGLVYCNKTSDTIKRILESVQKSEESEQTIADIKELKEILGELEEKAAEMADILVNGVRLPKVDEDDDFKDYKPPDDSEIHDLGVVGNAQKREAVDGSIENESKRPRESTLSLTPAAD